MAVICNCCIGEDPQKGVVMLFFLVTSLNGLHSPQKPESSFGMLAEPLAIPLDTECMYNFQREKDEKEVYMLSLDKDLFPLYV